MWCPAQAQLRLEEGNVYNARVLAHNARGEYREALKLAQQLLELRQRALPSDHADIGQSLNSLGLVYLSLGNLAAAELNFSKALAIWSGGSLNPVAEATIRNNLGVVYQRGGRYGDALLAYRAALAARERHAPSHHRDLAASWSGIAIAHRRLGQLQEAEAAYRRVFELDAISLASDHPDRARSYQNLAQLYVDQRRFDEAIALYGQAIAIFDVAWPHGHATSANTLNNLGHMQFQRREFARAEEAFGRVLAMQHILSESHPEIMDALSGMALIAYEREEWLKALGYVRQASTALARSRYHLGAGVREAAAFSRFNVSAIHLKVARTLGEKGLLPEVELASESFMVAQGDQQGAAAIALHQLNERIAAASTDLGEIVRRRQDLEERWRTAKSRLRSLLAQPTAQPDLLSEARRRLESVEAQLNANKREISERDRNYAFHAMPEPLSVEAARDLIHPDEALVMIVLGEGDSHLWIITKRQHKWLRLQTTLSQVQRSVEALRCGLDAALWSEGSDAARCREIVTGEPQMVIVQTEQGKRQLMLLPFAVSTAHELYRMLLAPAEALMEGKRLLLVASGPLALLPLSVLVVDPPIAGREPLRYANVAWLGTRRPLAVLPSVSALRALRAVSRIRTASRPYFGIGNPLLDGDQAHPAWGPHWIRQAEAARRNASCSGTRLAGLAQLVASAPAHFASLFRGGAVDLDRLRTLAPLPETTQELCDVGRSLGASQDDILLGERATEREIKRLSADGLLARYRHLHFATHGALAGQVEGSTEPGLVLTPPDKNSASESDDGYLTASEIATLKLDADWVILSACNTAGRGVDNAEALSGIARSFLYAGARALLVSHWEVNSQAAAKLATMTFAELQSDASIGRSEALRRSMFKVLTNGKPHETHPSYWAPFVIVGEGAPLPN